MFESKFILKSIVRPKKNPNLYPIKKFPLVPHEIIILNVYGIIILKPFAQVRN